MWWTQPRRGRRRWGRAGPCAAALRWAALTRRSGKAVTLLVATIATAAPGAVSPLRPYPADEPARPKTISVAHSTSPSSAGDVRTLPSLRLAPNPDLPQWFQTSALDASDLGGPTPWLIEPRELYGRQPPAPPAAFRLSAARDDSLDEVAITVPLPAYGVLGVTSLTIAMSYAGARWLKLRR